MKKNTFFFWLLLLCMQAANAQLTKGNWLVGGSASFSYSSDSQNSANTKVSTVSLSPNVGYFIFDKFASGVRMGYYNSKSKFNQPPNSTSKFSGYSVGPFLRYYLLSTARSYNIVTEASYQFGSDKVEINNTGDPISNNKFSFSLGPVIYFNSSVGLEFLLNYSSAGNSLSDSRAKTLGASIGLQIHLEKEKP